MRHKIAKLEPEKLTRMGVEVDVGTWRLVVPAAMTNSPGTSRVRQN